VPFGILTSFGGSCKAIGGFPGDFNEIPHFIFTNLLRSVNSQTTSLQGVRKKGDRITFADSVSPIHLTPLWCIWIVLEKGVVPVLGKTIGPFIWYFWGSRQSHFCVCSPLRPPGYLVDNDTGGRYVNYPVTRRRLFRAGGASGAEKVKAFFVKLAGSMGVPVQHNVAAFFTGRPHKVVRRGFDVIEMSMGVKNLMSVLTGEHACRRLVRRKVAVPTDGEHPLIRVKGADIVPFPQPITQVDEEIGIHQVALYNFESCEKITVGV
jgi:hypothetical protein